MKTAIRAILCALFAATVWAQNAAPLPFTTGTITGNDGLPCSGCLLRTYAGGTTTPLATYTDSTAGTPNTNPVVIDTYGRVQVWGTNVPYRLVLTDPGGATLWTVDNVLAEGFANGGPWTVNGINIYNTAGGKVCIANAPCPTPLAQLQVSGTSSGGANLIRVDDTSSNPGMDLFGSGVKFGSYDANSFGLHLRSSDGVSQITVAPALVTIENAGSGATTLILQSGAGQSATDLYQIKDNAGTVHAGIDSSFRYYAPLFNSTCTASAIAFQTGNSNYSVDCLGDMSSTGQINLAAAGGVTATAANLFKIGGTTVIDNNRNAFVSNLTVSGTCTGCGGGGGGGSGTVNSGTQYQVTGYYPGTGTVVSGNANFTFNTSTQQATINSTANNVAGLTVTNGYINSAGGLTTAASTGLDIVALSGGMAAKAWTWVEEAAPSTANSGQLTSYADSTSHRLMISRYTSSTQPFYVVATTTGTLTNGHCVSIDSAGNFVDAGGACTTGGGGGTVSSATIHQLAIYAATGTTVSGDTGLTWSSGAGIVATGGVSTSGALVSTLSSGTAINANGNFLVNADGTISGKTININGGPGNGVDVTAATNIDSIQTTGGVSACVSGGCTSGQAYSVNGTKIVDSLRNGFFANMTVTGTCTGCVGSGIASINGDSTAAQIIAGTANQIIVTNSGATRTLSTPQNIGTGSSPSFLGMSLTGISGSTQCLHVNSAGTISGTGGDCTSGGSVSGIQGSTNQVLANGTTSGFQSGNVTLTLPQQIGTSSNVSFGAITPSGLVNSSLVSGVAFQAGSGNFQAFVNGNINGATINSSGGYQVGGGTVISSAQAAQFKGLLILNGGGSTVSTLDTSGNIVAGSRFFINNGTTFTGQTWSLGFGTTFTVNGGGSFSVLCVTGGIITGALASGSC